MEHAARALSEMMVMYTIYKHPKDAPRSYVVRSWYIRGAEDPTPGRGLIAETLEYARALIPQGCVRIERGEADDPTIVESWI